MATISGPMPAGSPMVIASGARFFSALMPDSRRR
jgi:hypothetical protein